VVHQRKRINEQQQYKIALIRFTDDLIGASILLTGLSLIVAKKGKQFYYIVISAEQVTHLSFN
jgi:hypothetical protein